MSVKLPCIKCELRDNSNGLFTCNGCQQSFCLNHITSHSNELYNRFEQIMNEYNLVNDIFLDYKKRTNDIQWKLQKREKEINQIKSQINEYQKQSNYSEKDLDKWAMQLEKFKTQLIQANQSKSFIESIYSLHDWLFNSREIKLYISFLLIFFIFYCILSFGKLNLSLSKITFSQVNGPIQLSKDASVAEHYGLDFISGSVRVNQIYSRGVHSIRLSFETFSSSKTFIGMIELNGKQSTSSSSSYGWFIGDKQVIDHKPGIYKIFQIIKKIWSFGIRNQLKHCFTRDEKQENTIEIEIDCDNLKIALNNKQMNEKYELDIDRKQFPLPWQIIIELDHNGDRVRLQ
ncbi:unnamed protein product [Rotaria sordida]|uniref:Uncharacterized protein n=1 Tax=Rotaria sordida TaxID=392033 RepID=A0A815C620_9BILA|nr:unnamed protein product [Rotaria sordida]CAF1109514.1 unnamed protein product [Rotaria sordida]CAF1122315.1 unnamed protein product [Rotaria sordida]CAF1282862.1 unnamed protein product [Rotaria sordida]CAF3711185.1 unnamed protein product [Rotaria sordida]